MYGSNLCKVNVCVDIVQINSQIVATRTGLNINADRSTIQGKEGMHSCFAVLLSVSRLEGRSSDTVISSPAVKL